MGENIKRKEQGKGAQRNHNVVTREEAQAGKIEWKMGSGIQELFMKKS